MTEPASEFLSPAELRDFTKKARRADQAKVLEADGIPFRRRGKQLVVSRHHVRQSLAGQTPAALRLPNVAAIR